MSEKIVETIMKQFDVLPKKIMDFISDNYSADIYKRRYFLKGIITPLTTLSVDTHDRWEVAEKDYNVNCLYGLPKDVFKKIEKQNTEVFVTTWNNVLEFITNADYISRSGQNYLLLLVRTHLITDYGYFNIVDTNRLFGVNNDR